jgi:ribosome-binding ATPase YchF (GTP1/OBG family)
MKIAFTGVNIPEGKVKYNDPVLEQLEKKFSPKKVSPYFVEFIKDGYSSADAVVISSASILDLLILDMEKIENRIERCESADVSEFLRKCLGFMEEERPLCDLEVSDDERAVLTELAPLSFKPTLILQEDPDDLDMLIKEVMEKAGVTFFYTAGKPEVHAWFIKKGTDIVTCAGKIHSDLARGFIKADVINIRDYADAHNLNDARSKGLVKLVDRDYEVQEGDIIEIRFNV